MSDNCEACGEESDELCGDGYCRACHVSLSFEDCCDGSWVQRTRRAAGLPPSEAYPALVAQGRAPAGGGK